MTSQVFQVDTKGICLLCLCIGDSVNETATANSISATWFKKFLRYLKIDIMDLEHLSSPYTRDLNGPDALAVSVMLCQRCSLVTSQFLQLFQEFEKIRLELDNCAQTLHEAIREGQEDGNRVREYRERLGTPETSHISPKDALNASVADRLREKTLEKCALRLASSTPKLIITKMTLPPVKYSPASGTTSDKNIKKKSNHNHKFVFANAEEVSSDIGHHYFKEEIEDSDDIASPSLTVSESPTNDPLAMEEGPVMVKAVTPPYAVKPIKLQNGKFMCPQCGKILCTYYSSWRHRREMHMPKQAFRCQHCHKHKTFPRRRALDKHIELVHPFLRFSDSLPVGTTETEFSLVLGFLLSKVKQHSATYRKTGGVGDYCTLCGKVVTLHKRYWGGHILAFHGDHIISKVEKSKRSRNQEY